MRVTIVGTGDVGTGITERLAGTHEVCVVDTDADRLEAIETAQNVRTVEGDGRSLDVLAEAGIEAADILVASTDSDGANVMICGAAKNRADVDTIARVKRIELYETWREAGDAFGIDRMLCVNRLTARNLVRATTLPGALAVDTFADGHAEMASPPSVRATVSSSVIVRAMRDRVKRFLACDRRFGPDQLSSLHERRVHRPVRPDRRPTERPQTSGKRDILTTPTEITLNGRAHSDAGFQDRLRDRARDDDCGRYLLAFGHGGRPNRL